MSFVDRLVRRGNKTAKELYLGLFAAEDYPEQCPESEYAKWYDMLWFALPVVGFLMFVIAIEDRAK